MRSLWQQPSYTGKALEFFMTLQGPWSVLSYGNYMFEVWRYNHLSFEWMSWVLREYLESVKGLKRSQRQTNTSVSLAFECLRFCEVFHKVDITCTGVWEIMKVTQFSIIHEILFYKPSEISCDSPVFKYTVAQMLSGIKLGTKQQFKACVPHYSRAYHDR